MMINDIEKIINDGVLAPSGENCQPWKFELNGNRLSIFNIPEADMSLYNLKQRGSYIAHGALIENIIISSGAYGYTTPVSL
ncbi:MAG: nitroreductase, partial [Candidatus Pacebacteria bacterium]|nr:nitroreductase [Candidatus Paceibacterota bacterium]